MRKWGTGYCGLGPSHQAGFSKQAGARIGYGMGRANHVFREMTGCKYFVFNTEGENRIVLLLARCTIRELILPNRGEFSKQILKEVES